MKETLRKQKLFFISLIGIVVVSLVMGTTFAYQTIKINGESERVLVLESGVLDVEYKNTNLLNVSNMPLVTEYALAEDYIEFTVDNSKSSEDVAFKIGIENIEYGYIDKTDNKNEEVSGCRAKTDNVQAACIIDESFKYTIVQIDNNKQIEKIEGDFVDLSTNEVVLNNYFRIKKGKKTTYRLYLWLEEKEDNQNHLENTYFKGKVVVTSLFFDEVNPYDNNTNSLAYNIIENAKNITDEEKNLGYAEFRKTPKTVPAKGELAQNESTLSVTPDNYTLATSIDSYYFRGSVKNNYLEFNNMCFRIVRIEGDGSVKLILAAEKKCSEIIEADKNSAFIGMGYFGSKNIIFSDELFMQVFPDYETENITDSLGLMPESTTMKYAMDVFINGGSFKSLPYNNAGWTGLLAETKHYIAWSDNLKAIIKNQNICIGDTSTMYDVYGNNIDYQGFGVEYSDYYFDNYIRLNVEKNITLQCKDSGLSNEQHQAYPLTIDEILFGGSYLKDNAILNYVTLSVYRYNFLPSGYIYKDDYSDFAVEDGNGLIRPALSLIQGIELASDSGNGTITSPYKINVNQSTS